MEIVGKTNIFHDLLMQTVGKTNNSNNFHEFRETSGAGAVVWRIMEIVGKKNFSMTCSRKMLVKPTISMIFEKPREPEP